jgi:hypothetical protein
MQPKKNLAMKKNDKDFTIAITEIINYNNETNEYNYMQEIFTKFKAHMRVLLRNSIEDWPVYYSMFNKKKDEGLARVEM